jgi:hypothetical protein
MKTKLLLSLLLSFIFCLLSSQVPQGFTYQAIARDGSGNPLAGITINVKLGIQADTSAAPVILWEEQHTGVKTNAFGLFSVILGKGTQSGGSATSFSTVNWKAEPLYLKTQIFYNSTWKYMGSSKLWSVPYSLVSKNLSGPIDKLAIAGTTPFLDDALFEVRNKDGRIVFAVYNEGVRIYVDDGLAGKAGKGGFAIGGFDKAKGTIQNYFLVKPDTIRMWVDDTPGKATKGGFAIGGFDKAKGTSSEYLGVKPTVPEIINPSQARILWYPLKEAFMTGRVFVPSPDSVGFNSFSSGYQSRAIGNWSQALGYNAVARGNNSTSIGYNSLAKNANSYAFGTNAQATGLDSYAFGANARATGEKSFALGSVGKDTNGIVTTSTIASGYGSFSAGLGSVASGDGAFTLGIINMASGIGSLAMGYGTSATGMGSTTLGVGSVVEVLGDCALATGILTKAGNWASAAFGDRTYAKGHTSFATGYATTAEGQLSATFGAASYASGFLSFATGLFTTASGWGSTAFGGFTTASGIGAVAMGDNTLAQAYGSLAIGRFNVAAGNPVTWGFWDPVLMVGNGSSSTQRSNAFTVYNSGIADFGSFINLSTNSTYKQAIYVNNNEALWYDGTHFSWGYGANYNFFSRPVTIGGGDAPPSYTLNVNGTINSTGGYYNVSDARWKKDLVPLMNTLPLLVQINGFRFNWRDDDFAGMNFDKGTQIGIIAQEIEKLFPELVRTDDKGYKAVAYDKLSVILLQGMKEQQQQIESAREENTRLQYEIQSLKERMEKIETMVVKNSPK